MNMKVAGWVVRVLLALAFAGSGLFKLSGAPAVVDEFAKVGFGQGFRYLVALIELTGAVLIVWPRTVATGALILCCVCIGAFFAQLFRLHLGIGHTIVLGGLCVAIAWFYRAGPGIGARRLG